MTKNLFLLAASVFLAILFVPGLSLAGGHGYYQFGITIGPPVCWGPSYAYYQPYCPGYGYGYFGYSGAWPGYYSYPYPYYYGHHRGWAPGYWGRGWAPYRYGRGWGPGYRGHHH